MLTLIIVKIADKPSHGTRVLLNIDVEGPLSLVLPLNQLSTQAIVAETTAIHISNRFVFASEVSKDVDVFSMADYPGMRYRFFPSLFQDLHD